MPLNHNDHFVVNAAQPSRRQVIEFKLSEEVLEEILNGNQSIQLDMNQAKLLVGSNAYDFTQMPGINNIEVYKLAAGTKQLDLVGDITSRCTIQRTHAKKGQKKAIRHEPLRTTQVIDAKDLKKGSKSTAQLPVRRPQSPAPPAAAAAAVATTAAAAAGTVVPLRTRVVQLLAQYPVGTEEKELLKFLRVSVEDLQSILSSVANYAGGRFILKPETYREVKIYDWKNYSAKQRDVVVKNASAAFDKLGLSSDAVERDILSPEKTKRASPPLVAIGNMDSTNPKWRTGGGGSESEGLENGRTNIVKPSTQKKTSAKKPTMLSLTSKKKTTSSSKSGTKGIRQSTVEKAAAAILDNVPNHSRGVTTPSSSLKLPLSGTPGNGVVSPTMAGRRPSINGSGVSSSLSTSTAAATTSASGATGKQGSERKRTSKDTGGVGNGYKIPKVGSATTIPKKSQSPIFTVPPITTQAEYEVVSKKFMTKYQEMKKLKEQIDVKKEVLDKLGAELERARNTDRELELKRKVQEAFGEEVIDRKVLRRSGEPRSGVRAEAVAAAIAEQSRHMSVRTMIERYKTLYNEVDTMKRALWEAGTAQAERVSQSVPGSAGGRGGDDFSSALSKNPHLNRIGLEPMRRIMLITVSASFWGFILGGAIGSRQSSMQYLAENAHRLPKNMEGWYFYHKRKNYRMIWGAVQKGAVYSAKTGALVGLFEVLEASADFYRGGADLFNSMMAGIASGGIFAVANKLPRQSTKHTLMLGAGYGLVSGGLQDLSSFLKGTPVWYLPQSLKERSLALKLPVVKRDE
ncbi:hypothetical protein BG011_005419 [Mortierella polycephala]|uniref:Uncharacterized protein n=1 Tax=Mortierella polycephala TaxID=41804 RepID=A0A9P6PY47_9FUNG|nr:hypothetical protein BG011_005419 [Mortierella polycephala]